MKNAARAAWRQLADRFDPPRAAWIARALKPLNPEDRPANPIAADQPLPKPPRFPSPATKAESWTRAPATRVSAEPVDRARLQERPAGRKRQRGPIPIRWRPVPIRLAVSQRRRQSGIDDGMKWMVDFDAAEKVGMGIRAKLTSEDAAAGLDFILVMGIKDSLDRPTDWAPQLAELFDAHHYTDGLSFVPQARRPTTRRMRRPVSARKIPVTKRAISPNDRSGISARRRIQCRCADNRALDSRTPVRFCQPAQCHGKRTAGRAAHEHGSVAGDMGLLPVADARRRRRQ